MDKKRQIIQKLNELYTTLPQWEKAAVERAFEVDGDKIYVLNIVRTQGNVGYLFTYYNSYLCKITQKGIETLQLLSTLVGVKEMVILDYISPEINKKINLKT